MTMYDWPGTRVQLLTSGSRLERERWIEAYANGDIVSIPAFTGDMLDAMTQGVTMRDFRQRYVQAGALAFAEIQLLDGKPATIEEFGEILWGRYKLGKSTVLAGEYVPRAIIKIFGEPEGKAVE